MRASAPQPEPVRGTNHTGKSRYEPGKGPSRRKVPSRTQIHKNLADEAGKAFRDLFNAVRDEFPAADDFLTRDERDRLKGARGIPFEMAHDLVFRLQKRLVPEYLTGPEFTSRYFMQPAFLNVTSTVPMYTAALLDEELRKRGLDPKRLKKHRLSDREIAKHHRGRHVVTLTDAQTIEVLIADKVVSEKEARRALLALKTKGAYRNATYRRLEVRNTAAVLDIDLGAFEPNDVQRFRRENAPRLPLLIPTGIEEALARVLIEGLVADSVVSKDGAQDATEALATRLREMAPGCANAFTNDLGLRIDRQGVFEEMIADARTSAANCAPKQELTMLLYALTRFCVPES